MQALKNLERIVSLHSRSVILHNSVSSPLAVRLTLHGLKFNTHRELSTNTNIPSSEETKSGENAGVSTSNVINKAPNSLGGGVKSGYTNEYCPEYVTSMLSKVEGDMPISDMTDPFTKDYKRCFLCTKDIKLDHKNVRLLSQFVSPYTGRIYGRAITGLCIPMQKQVAKYIKRARVTGYMSHILKDPKYFSDPAPYDPMKR